MRLVYQASACPLGSIVGAVIHHNEDSERHEVVRVNVFNKNSNINKRRTYYESNMF